MVPKSAFNVRPSLTKSHAGTALLQRPPALPSRTGVPPGFAARTVAGGARECACGGNPGVSGDCEESRKKRLGTLQRQAAAPQAPVLAPPSVHPVLDSPGQPLDAATRGFMEPRFGHDFSQVRVHTDSQAARSAQSVNALAYTVGSSIVFAAGQYTPQTNAGRRLLAHELTHVLQQRQADPSTPLEIDASHEQAAEAASAAIVAGSQPGAVATAGRQGLARATPDYAETEKQILHELNMNMPVAILGMIDALDAPTRARLSVDPVITEAIAKLPPNTRALIQKHLDAGGAKGMTVDSSLAMTRLQFDYSMKNRYRVKTVRTGKYQEQAMYDLKESEWKSWDPGSSSTVYNWIVAAFADLEKTFGGLPQVDEMVFFRMRYKTDGNNHVVEDPKTGASFNSGKMVIYEEVQKGNQIFNLKDNVDTPTPEEAVRGNIVHELGHGIGETALTHGSVGPLGADPQLYEEYKLAVGWAIDGKLYDIQEPVVQQAIQKDKAVPPLKFQITPDNFWMKPWKEHPLTGYMADSFDEDFAEAIMAYVYHRKVLETLSPARFKFIEDHKARWIASGHPELNLWEQAKAPRPTSVLRPSKPLP